MSRVIKLQREHGIVVLIVEQNIKESLEMADRTYGSENGRFVLEWKSRDLFENDYVRKACLR